MRTLSLMRHGEASPVAPDSSDHDRKLAERGRVDAASAAARITALAHPPSLVLCSSARRAVASLDAMRAALLEDVEVEIMRGLYLAGSDELLAAIHAADERHASLLVVGHNPGIGWLARSLAHPGPGAEGAVQRLSRSFPTGALIVLDFDAVRWRDIAPRSGVVSLLTMPGETPSRR
ncbi:MAG: histidine phosphatase family protein [Myxococcota bacterium]